MQHIDIQIKWEKKQILEKIKKYHELAAMQSLNEDLWLVKKNWDEKNATPYDP